jgi:hypothetical protein
LHSCAAYAIWFAGNPVILIVQRIIIFEVHGLLFLTVLGLTISGTWCYLIIYPCIFIWSSWDYQTTTDRFSNLVNGRFEIKWQCWDIEVCYKIYRRGCNGLKGML